MDEPIENIEKQVKPVGRMVSNHSPYTMAKLLKQTAQLSKQDLLSHTKAFELARGRQRNGGQGLPSIVMKMYSSRTELQLTMYRNHDKLNASFSGYLQSEMTLTQDELKKKKITKFKKAEDKGLTLVETPPLDRDDTHFLDLNLRMTPLLNRCFDSLFPAIRYNATLFQNDRQIYLLGGYHQHPAEGVSLFHRYDF